MAGMRDDHTGLLPWAQITSLYGRRRKNVERAILRYNLSVYISAPNNVIKLSAPCSGNQ